MAEPQRDDRASGAAHALRRRVLPERGRAAVVGVIDRLRRDEGCAAVARALDRTLSHPGD